MDGFINLKKERGMTSFKCVAAIKRILGVKKVGHAGTLDPETEGVLPICVGQGSKCSEYFLRMKKTYRAEVTFGYSTDTMDIWGTEKERFEGDLSFITEERVKEALGSFVGEIEQVPSMYSAIKKDGVPLYKLARKGIEAEVAPRQVNVYNITMEGFSKGDGGALLPKAVFTVTCSKGTYVRSICNDLGELLGCHGVMSSLCRTNYGAMDFCEGVTLEELAGSEDKEKYILPVEFALGEFPSVKLNDTEIKRYIQGKTVIMDFSRFVWENPIDGYFGNAGEGGEVTVYADKKVLAVAKTELLEQNKVRLVPNKFFGLN